MLLSRRVRRYKIAQANARRVGGATVFGFIMRRPYIAERRIKAGAAVVIVERFRVVG